MPPAANNSGPDAAADAAARRVAPATARNRDSILNVLGPRLKTARRVLETASGTGEHAVYFQAAMPWLVWTPSDPDPAARASGAAWARHAGVDMPSPLDINAARPGWEDGLSADAVGASGAPDTIICINMIHIAPWAAAEGLMRGAGRILAAGGLLFLYGPFREGGRHTAPSNAAFDESLRAQNPAWGVRDLDEVTALAAASGLALEERIPMPANNLIVIFHRSPEGPPD